MYLEIKDVKKSYGKDSSYTLLPRILTSLSLLKIHLTD